MNVSGKCKTLTVVLTDDGDDAHNSQYDAMVMTVQ
jgi:hypothetical protein